ncbi:hypothetical protein BKG80_03605 [Mycobacteroides chelonae]|uniref:hypothetical protein n=1 Tax=Mycobacteroides chelonae TaxID=1774 RepID=UPI0008A9DE36|nr:hypothetical protein [Mycobacteroides chelonae]MBF9349965.1 hypothetical protein [Mycobacteroides chelonae]OHU42043.1 hypothetical protein BKG80_03605 [Mycobacteroides chelonae]
MELVNAFHDGAVIDLDEDDFLRLFDALQNATVAGSAPRGPSRGVGHASHVFHLIDWLVVNCPGPAFFDRGFSVHEAAARIGAASVAEQRLAVRIDRPDTSAVRALFSADALTTLAAATDALLDAFDTARPAKWKPVGKPRRRMPWRKSRPLAAGSTTPQRYPRRTSAGTLPSWELISMKRIQEKLNLVDARLVRTQHFSPNTMHIGMSSASKPKWWRRLFRKG